MKIKKILQVIVLLFCCIALRVWHLSVVQREAKEVEAVLPQRRALVHKPDRGAIYDRFGIPMAENRISYQATLYYSEIASLPVSEWKRNEQGEKVRIFPRKEYISNLSAMLSSELGLEAAKIEDFIYAKASLFPHAPYVLKVDLTEEQYSRLRMKEREWPGLHAEIASQRVYPLGKVGCHVIGTMGLISQSQYLSLAQEIKEMESILDGKEQGDLPDLFASYDEVEEALQKLKEKAYTIHDLVGKSGVEALAENELRGSAGKSLYEVDVKGHRVQLLPESKGPISGNAVQLTLSSELQAYAEGLLAEDEEEREGRSFGIDPLDQKRKKQKQPWIKGGSIVAMDPNTGEILALASYPRFDPNDFLQKTPALSRWLENDSFIGSIWDGLEPMIRERRKEEALSLSWSAYLRFLLAPETPLFVFFQKVEKVKDAIQLQEDFEALLYHSGSKNGASLISRLFSQGASFLPKEALSYQRRIESALSPIPSHADKLFALDLLRLAVYAPAFSDALLEKIGSLSIERYRALEQSFHRIETVVQKQAKEDFHYGPFAAWKFIHQKDFLQEMRKKEKATKSYARPYIDYLDKKERELFAEYWKEKRIEILTSLIQSPSSTLPLSDVKAIQEATRLLPLSDFLTTFRSFRDLDRPLFGSYVRLRHYKEGQTEKDLASAFYPTEGFGMGRSYAFQISCPPGSIFKVVPAYEALRQLGPHPLTLIDEQKGNNVAFTLDGTPYPRIYKGGRLPRTAMRSVGKIDLAAALEQSSNPYFAILAGDFFKQPDDLLNAARLFGFGSRTGLGLSGEAKGNLPTDLAMNRTGLYAFSIGQHTLLATPVQAAVCFAAIANGGTLVTPHLLGSPSSHTLPLTPQERSLLIEGLDRVIWGSKGGARPQSIRKLKLYPQKQAEYLSLEHQFVGKTGTAEIAHCAYPYPSCQAQIYKHTWFAGFSFSTPRQTHPELVVIVSLRYGDSGREAAPLAASVIHKWREIKRNKKI